MAIPFVVIVIRQPEIAVKTFQFCNFLQVLWVVVRLSLVNKVDDPIRKV